MDWRLNKLAEHSKIMSENNRITGLDGKPVNPEQKLSFKDSILLNLERNKLAIKSQIQQLERKLELCDKVAVIVNNNPSVCEFSQLMSELQQDVNVQQQG